MNAASLQEIDLANCLRRARTTVEPLTREPQIKISEIFEPDLQVRGNPERLIEAFANLECNQIQSSKR